jgi:L-threonylcarbamoyladenylate synthase
MVWNDNNLIQALLNNKIIVMPTDTIYGIVGSALHEKVVNRIYDIRKRAPEKPCIILIGDIRDLEKFSIYLSNEQKEKIKEYWPGPVSIVLDCIDQKFFYLHRGTQTLAFRMPQQIGLQNLLKKVGPIIAPSANLEGFLVANNIHEARNYFHELVDLYIDGGDRSGKASKVIKLHKDGTIHILRE